MLLKDITERGLKILQNDPYNFMAFYRSYYLALNYHKFVNKLKINEEEELKKKKALKIYYFEALQRAIAITPRLENESNRQYNSKVMFKYFQLRKNVFIFLEQSMRKDVGLIISMVSTFEESSINILRKNIDTKDTWLIKDD